MIVRGIPCPTISGGDVQADAVADGFEFFQIDESHLIRPAKCKK
jgi:hypothetical protein